MRQKKDERRLRSILNIATRPGDGAALPKIPEAIDRVVTHAEALQEQGGNTRGFHGDLLVLMAIIGEQQAEIDELRNIVVGETITEEEVEELSPRTLRGLNIMELRQYAHKRDQDMKWGTLRKMTKEGILEMLGAPAEAEGTSE